MSEEKEELYFWLMDGRASYDIDKAIVLQSCDTLDQAIANIDNYGADTCIVAVTPDDKPQELLWCLLWGEPDKLTLRDNPILREKIENKEICSACGEPFENHLYGRQRICLNSPSEGK